MIKVEWLADVIEGTEPQRGACNRVLDSGQTDRAAHHYALRGSGRLEVAGCKNFAIATRTVIVPAPGRRARLIVANRAHGGKLIVASIAMRVTYQGVVGIFDHLRQPLVEDVSANGPVRRALEELLEEIDAQRNPSGERHEQQP